jgi:soluble lytic murein transglycosylase-like protein
MRRLRALLIALSLAQPLLFGSAGAAEVPTRSSLCLMLEAAARTNDLPLAFFARVIWRESRFDPQAVGPPTRTGTHAEGIAQFMARTAADRGLPDPFDPVQALPKAAEYLHDLRQEFGNLGLAAAAYNAGPARVHGWLDGARTMPEETRRYVQAITGRSVDEWAKAGTVTMVVPKEDCLTLVASLREGAGGFFYDLENRVTAALAKPWGVELAAGFSRTHVLAAYSRLMGNLSSLIGSHDPIVSRTTLRSRGTRPLYQARIGADTRLAANTICGKIQRAGEACFVLRNGRR